MSTVPAHPKSENVACSVTEPPSWKPSVSFTWRMYPEPSIDTTTLSEV